MIKKQGIFTGTDTAGYENGSTYTILINQSEIGCPISIVAIGETFVGSVSYNTINLFLTDWNNLKNI
jgi:hypothetical protein